MLTKSQDSVLRVAVSAGLKGDVPLPLHGLRLSPPSACRCAPRKRLLLLDWEERSGEQAGACLAGRAPAAEGSGGRTPRDSGLLPEIAAGDVCDASLPVASISNDAPKSASRFSNAIHWRSSICGRPFCYAQRKLPRQRGSLRCRKSNVEGTFPPIGCFTLLFQQRRSAKPPDRTSFWRLR